jgi:hypothetical protein
MSIDRCLPPAVLAALLAAPLAFLPVSSASAQGTAEERSACEGDAFRFCMSDIPSVSKIEACLIANEAQLSPACRAEFAGSPERKTKLRERHFQR